MQVKYGFVKIERITLIKKRIIGKKLSTYFLCRPIATLVIGYKNGVTHLIKEIWIQLIS